MWKNSQPAIPVYLDFCIHAVFALAQPQGKNAIRFKDLRKG